MTTREQIRPNKILFYSKSSKVIFNRLIISDTVNVQTKKWIDLYVTRLIIKF